MKTFVWACAFNGLESEGTGRSKKEAKAAAAKALKQQLDFDSLPQPGDKKRKSMASPAGPAPFQKKKKVPDFAQRQFQPQNFGNFFPGPPVPFGVYPAPNGADMMNPQFDGFYSDAANDDLHNCNPAAPPVNFGYAVPMFNSRLSKLDKYVIKKHTEIYPEQSELSVILQLVKDTEECMKHVADDLNKPGEEPDSQEAAGDKIKGMVRVGDLAKGLLLRDSRDVQVRSHSKDELL
jgi:hypothetical protein